MPRVCEKAARVPGLDIVSYIAQIQAISR
jgi:hypothetical protein